jgi:hypothetical protein
VVLEAGETNHVDFDQIELKLETESAAEEGPLNPAGPLVYPNPSSGAVLYIRNRAFEVGQIIIYDLLGRPLLYRELYGESPVLVRFPDQLEPGLYVVDICSDNQHKSCKFLVR